AAAGDVVVGSQGSTSVTALGGVTGGGNITAAAADGGDVSIVGDAVHMHSSSGSSMSVSGRGVTLRAANGSTTTAVDDMHIGAARATAQVRFAVGDSEPAVLQVAKQAAAVAGSITSDKVLQTLQAAHADSPQLDTVAEYSKIVQSATGATSSHKTTSSVLNASLSALAGLQGESSTFNLDAHNSAHIKAAGSMRVATGDSYAGSGGLVLGSGSAAGGAAGSLLLSAGVASAQGGNITLQAGAANTAGGDVSIVGGSSAQSAAGRISLRTGSAAKGSGEAVLLTGDAVWGASGSITVATGDVEQPGSGAGDIVVHSNAHVAAGAGGIAAYAGSSGIVINTSGTVQLRTEQLDAGLDVLAGNVQVAAGASGRVQLVAGSDGDATLQAGSSVTSAHGGAVSVLSGAG
ncbi:MAG: hypothetical protein GY739_20830, partial [Mesoflavibacter sp.]|nr:hypothetical protein [Mesoflavibacter sp.]